MKPYPQMPPFTQDELEAFLKEATLARLGSLNLDGMIHIAPVFFKYEDGEILIGIRDVTNKVTNVKHNPNVTLLRYNHEPPWKGVLIYCEAQLDYEDVITKRVCIFEGYLPVENACNVAKGLVKNYSPGIILVNPQRITSYDYSERGFIQVNLANGA